MSLESVLLNGKCQDSCLRVHRTGLNCRLKELEVVSWRPIPEVQGSIATSRNKNVVSVDGEWGDDVIVSRHVLDENTVWETPLFQIVRRSCSHHIQIGVECKRPDALLVIGQSCLRPPSCYHDIPKSNGAVVRRGDDLRFAGLATYLGHGIGVLCQAVCLNLGSHIPQPSSGISTTVTSLVQRMMDIQSIHCTCVSMVMPNNLVVFDIPACDILVVTTREEVRLMNSYSL